MVSLPILRARATPVVVPSKPDSVNSPEVVDDTAAFAAEFHSGDRWAEFALVPKYILELTAANGLVGIGETYRDASAESVQTALAAIVGQDLFRLDWRRLPCSDPRVYDGLESAAYDLAGRALGVPIHQLLGGAAQRRIDCSGWTGRRTPADAARKAREALARGHRVFKFKCSDDDPVAEWVAAIRSSCGAGIQVLLDPNQRWHDAATTLRRMTGVDPAGMYGLEDPIARSDYAGFRALRQALGIPVFIHIAIPYLSQGQRAADVLAALREDCVDGFNFNGPMAEFVRLADLAALAGKPCWHGSEVDLGILEVSALHAAAASSACTIPSDLFGELVRENDLIVPGIRFVGGYAEVPTGPGLGVELDRAALARYRSGPELLVS